MKYDDTCWGVWYSDKGLIDWVFHVGSPAYPMTLPEALKSVVEEKNYDAWHGNQSVIYKVENCSTMQTIILP